MLRTLATIIIIIIMRVWRHADINIYVKNMLYIYMGDERKKNMLLVSVVDDTKMALVYIVL